MVINTRQVEKLYQVIAGASNLSMNIEGNSFQFKLGDVSQALARLESCYSGKSPDMSTASLSQPIGAPQNILSATPEQVTWTRPSEVAMPASQPRRVKPGQVWRASAGDSLQVTLTRWAQDAGVEIDWQADMGGEVMSDVAMATSFEDAVQTLIAENAAATGIQADLRGGTRSDFGRDIESAYRSGTAVSSPPTSILPASTRPAPRRSSIMTSSSAMPAMSGISSAKWSARQGTNLRVALERWSAQAGVDVHWLANQSYAVRMPVQANSTYEEAIRQLLGQYSNEATRPYAELNNDPISGRRTLIIQTSNIL